jgi:MarR family transcriptional regulator, organic hydroperoxide resistance regulator
MTRKRINAPKSTTAQKPARLQVLQGNKHPLTVNRPELLVDGSDRDFRRLVNGLFPFLSLHTSIRNGYADLLGLTGPAYTILLAVRTLGDSGPVNVRTIADQLRLSGSFITAETNQLEREGLITKRRAQEDKRMVSISLTPKAAALLDSIAPLRRRVNDAQFGCLSREEFRLLVPLIQRLIQSAEEALTLLEFLKQQEAGLRQRGKKKAAGAA